MVIYIKGGAILTSSSPHSVLVYELTIKSDYVIEVKGTGLVKIHRSPAGMNVGSYFNSLKVALTRIADDLNVDITAYDIIPELSQSDANALLSM